MSTLTRRAWYFGLSSGASIVSTFVTLPVLTRVLGPADYGAFSLVTSYANTGTLLATAGLTFVLAPALPAVTGRDRQGLVSTLVVAALVLAAIVTVAGMAVLLSFRSQFDTLAGIPSAALVYAAGASILTAPWLVVTDVLTIDGRAGQYASLLILQTVVTSVGSIVAAYTFDLGTESLFVGAFAGTAALAVAMVLVVRRDLRLVVERTWLRELTRTGPSVAASNATEALRNIVERTIVSARFGLGDLGVYAHAQAYRSYGIEAVNPISRGLYPVALAEAQDDDSTFVTTGNAWGLAQLLIVGAGLVFAFVGNDVVAALTHGKFDGAGDLAAAWMVVLLVQMSGKPQSMTLIGRNEGARVARASLVAVLIGIAVLVVAVPTVGLVGAVAAQGVQFSVYRMLLGRAARRFRAVPFQDQWVVVGAIVIGLSYSLRQALEPATPVAFAMLVAALLALAVAGREVLSLPARTVLGRGVGLLRRALPGPVDQALEPTPEAEHRGESPVTEHRRTP
jgi:O-antigen/teichoic acid export membrane protein